MTKKQTVKVVEPYPCPVCNSADVRVYESFKFDNTYRVECSKCTYHCSKYCASKHRAMVKWNSRVETYKK